MAQGQETYYYPETVTTSERPSMSYGYGTMADSEPCGMMDSGMMGGCGMDMMPAGMMAHHGGMMGRSMRGGRMMAGYAMGPIMELNLSDTQRAQINKIADGLRQQHWSAMGQIMTQQSKLRDLYATDSPDPKQVGDTFGAIAKLRQDMVVAQVKAHNDAMALLSNDQRAQLKRLQHGDASPSPPASGQGQGQAPPPQGQAQTPTPQGQTQIPPPPSSR